MTTSMIEYSDQFDAVYLLDEYIGEYMRRNKNEQSSDFKIAIVDDEQGIIDSISVIVKRLGYAHRGFTNPIEAIQKIQEEHYDLLILDYLMSPIHGDEVIRRIRSFNKDIYILMLTGHKDLAPPLETLKILDIQGYAEKSDRFDQLILLIESGIKSVKQMRTIKNYKDGLNTLVAITPEIYKLKPVEQILKDILNKIRQFFGCSDAFMVVDGFGVNANASIYSGIGKFNSDLQEFIAMRDALVIEMMGSARTNLETTRRGQLVAFPLSNEKGQPIGVLYVDGIGSELTYQLIEMLSRQAGVAICNTMLHHQVNIKSEELSRAYAALEKMYIETVQALRLAVDARDVYTRGHSDRVAVYAVRIGEAFGLPVEELELLRLGGVFHDIGKIATADKILFKMDSLDSDEYEEVKKHPIRGAGILSAVSMFEQVVPLVMNHHERIDGRGYPSGIIGDAIPFLSRILSVADAFDAMTTTRLYRQKIGRNEAIKQLEVSAGSQFDKEIVSMFVNMITEFGDLFIEMPDSCCENLDTQDIL